MAVRQHAPPRPRSRTAAASVELLKVELEIATREAEGQYAGFERVGKLKEATRRGRSGPDRGLTSAAEGREGRPVAACSNCQGEAANRPLDATAAEGRRQPPAAATEAAALDEPPSQLDRPRRAATRPRATTPLVFGEVDAHAVAAVVGDWTGIPIGRMVKNEIASVLTHRRPAQAAGGGPGPLRMDAIANRIQTSRAKPRQPQQAGGRLHAARGPSGVGKTETAHVAVRGCSTGGDDRT